MAPTWPELLVEHFLHGYVNVVQEGMTILVMAGMLYMKLKEGMLSEAKVPITKDDLTMQFQHFGRLWGSYQKDKRSATLACVRTSPEHFTLFLFYRTEPPSEACFPLQSMKSKNIKNKDAMMRNLVCTSREHSLSFSTYITEPIIEAIHCFHCRKTT